LIPQSIIRPNQDESSDRLTDTGSDQLGPLTNNFA